MTKEFLMGLIENSKSLELLLIVLASFITIGITVRLGIQFLKAHASLLGFITGVLGLTIYGIVARLYLPILTTVTLMIPLTGLVLAILCKANYIKAFGYACILILSNFMGEVILGVIGSIFKQVGSFILSSTYGIVVGILSEVIIPLAVLVARKEPVIPLHWKSKEMLMNSLIYFLEAFIILWSLINFYSKKMQFDDFLLLIVTSTLFCHLYFLNSSNLKKQHKEQIDTIHENIEHQADALQAEFDLIRKSQSQNRRKYDSLPPHVKDKFESFLYDSTIFAHKLNTIQNEFKQLL